MKKIQTFLNKRLGFMTFLIICLWLKTVIAYYIDFSLSIENLLQHFFAIVNPFATIVLLMSLALYINKAKISYIVMGVIYIADSLFIYANILYYRELSDFISASTIVGVGKVAKGLGSSTVGSMQLRDIIYLIDFIIIILLFATRFVKIDQRPFRKINALATTCLGIALFSADLAGSEANRPQLLGRTFDHSYIVKYLGINTFLAYDAVRSVQNDQVRSSATETEIDSVLDYTKQNYAAPNPKYFGKANGKNIIIIHLESFEQFLIDMKVNGQEVTPFLNSLYNDQNTISFDNFYHEVGSGRTSDAETMLESGLFGLPEGSFFQKLGGDNTFQAAPAILGQKKGYKSAVFHGNSASFWGRNVTYKNMGYNYFFDESYYDVTPGSLSENNYGIKDKLLFSEGVKYLEQMQQPFYVKFLTVTNHVGYPLSDEDNGDFQTSDTSIDTVNRYFKTAHYLDKSVEEFFNYLKATGLDKKSMVVLYGDHYGLNSEQHADGLSTLLGKTPDTWTEFDTTHTMQKVPFMIHMDGLKGGINHTYGGEIDVLPTLLHLAGINTKQYVQVGTDLFSKQHNSIVAFRNKNFVTPHYTVYRTNGKTRVYSNDTGEQVDMRDNPELLTKVEKWEQEVDLRLKTSDSVNNKNLLRFYTPFDFMPVNPANYSYQNQVQQMEKIRNDLGDKSTSLYSKNGNKSTTDLYNTDAVQLQDDRTPIDSWSYLNKDKK
ncbi:LTA synthase family protein [Companilactobacillus musae]|uniref:LTA synthase family protein n=1 Tax=Companilactobacillus musae TaxID=1903258 RepID=UPI000E64BC3B|nr:LTA synthase family protein [Companilactobacillus musae]